MAASKLVIFDLDGTLLNTLGDLGNATNHSLRALGFPERKMEEYNFLVGRGIMNLFRGALPQGCNSEANVMKMRGLFLPYYEAHISDETRPYPGIPQLLESLVSKGIKVAVASNKYQEGVEKLMGIFFPGVPFLGIMGQRDGFPIKPDPAVVDLILSRDDGIGKEETVYVGDTNVDMQTGANAGVDTIGVLWGFRPRKELEEGRPWKIVQSAEELERTILGRK